MTGHERKKDARAGHPAPGGAAPARGGRSASYQRLPGRPVPFRPGDALHLSPLPAGGTFSSEFVGACGREYLLLRLPDQDGARQALALHSPVAVRFSAPGCNLCGFSSAVAGFVDQPTPLLLLEYPAALNVLDLRRRERVACFLPARVSDESGMRKAIIADLSEDGCRLLLEPGTPGVAPPPAPGASLACNFRLFDVLEQLFVPGVVRHIRELAGRPCLGMQFTSLDREDRTRLGDYVAQVSALAAAG